MLTRLLPRNGWIALLLGGVLAWAAGRYHGASGGPAGRVMTQGLAEELSPPPIPEEAETTAFQSEEERVQAFAEWHRRLEALLTMNPEAMNDNMRAGGRLLAELDKLSNDDLQRFVQEALRAGATSGVNSVYGFGGMLLTLYARREPASALGMGITQLEELMQAGAPRGAETHARALFMFLTPSDPRLAWARWQQEAARQPPPKWLSERHQVGAIFRVWAQKDFVTAFRTAAALEGSLREKAFSRLDEGLKGMFQNEPSNWTPEAESLARDYFQVTDGKPNPGLIQHLVRRRLAHESGAEAAAWVESLGLPAASRSWADRAVAETWAQDQAGKEAAAAWSWLLSRREPDQRAETMAHAVRSWTQPFRQPGESPPPEVDLAACSEWLIGQGLGFEATGAISLLAQAWLCAGEPAAALTWARSIVEPTVREVVVQQVTDELQQRFPDRWQKVLREAKE